jgi:hypothetical protein
MLAGIAHAIAMTRVAAPGHPILAIPILAIPKPGHQYARPWNMSSR